MTVFNFASCSSEIFIKFNVGLNFPPQNIPILMLTNIGLIVIHSYMQYVLLVPFYYVPLGQILEICFCYFYIWSLWLFCLHRKLVLQRAHFFLPVVCLYTDIDLIFGVSVITCTCPIHQHNSFQIRFLLLYLYMLRQI